MRTIRKNTKNVVKDKKEKRLHPVQQAIKLSIAALIVIFLCVLIWLGRDYFKREVNVPSLNLPAWLDAILEKVILYAPIIFISIFALEGILAAVALIVNTDKCRLVCRIIIIILGVVFVLSLSYAGTSFIGIGEQIYAKIGAGSAEADTKSVVVMLLILASFFGPLILQIATLGFMLLTFEQEGGMNVVQEGGMNVVQEGGMNVATWFLFTVPGAGFVIAMIFLFKNLFAHGGGSGDDDGDSYDVIIFKR